MEQVEKNALESFVATAKSGLADFLDGLDTASLDAAAELIQSTISAAAPDDPKALRAITGALKDLKDLIDEPPGAAKDGGEIVIRVEGDAPEAP